MPSNDRPSFSEIPAPPKNESGEPQQWRDVPIDWEALEDAFENNAPEVHSYLHVPTGDVLRIVDGIADPQMHARIASDPNYLRIEPVSSREQYRWMERYIPMVDDKDLQNKLTRAIDGKGAFRRFKDVLMGYGPERERWFSFRSERLRIFMEAWLNAHALNPIKRPVWVPEAAAPAEEGAASEPTAAAAPPPPRRTRNADTLRRQVRDLADALGPRDLDTLVAFAEFLRARRAARPSRDSQVGKADDKDSEKEPEVGDEPTPQPISAPTTPAATESRDSETPSSRRVPAAKKRSASS